MTKLVCWALLVSTIISCKVLAVGDPVAGQIKAAQCVACHNADGNSVTPIWPKIAGLSQKYLLKQLLEFKKGPQGKRNDPTMYGIVQNLSQQDLEDLASYYAKQKMTAGVTQKPLLELGQAIYRGGNLLTGVPACASCHGPTGNGNPLANFPKLSGQNSAYVVAQLNNFKNKIRANDPNNMMEDIAAKMTDKEIEAVASYVSGLR